MKTMQISPKRQQKKKNANFDIGFYNKIEFLQNVTEKTQILWKLCAAGKLHISVKNHTKNPEFWFKKNPYFIKKPRKIKLWQRIQKQKRILIKGLRKNLKILSEDFRKNANLIKGHQK